MSLIGLDTEQLAALADANDVKIDKRWKRERIVATLEAAGVEAPAVGDKLSERVALEPVRFIGSIGRIHVRDSKWDSSSGEREFKAGLIVDFLDGEGEPVGGFSREFYPDLDEHEDSLTCSCNGCLADVRDYLSKHRHGKVLAETYFIREAKVNEPQIPVTGWQNINAGDVADLHEKLGFELENAVRYEQSTLNRADVLAALDKRAEQLAPEAVIDADILSAELTVG